LYCPPLQFAVDIGQSMDSPRAPCFTIQHTILVLVFQYRVKAKPAGPLRHGRRAMFRGFEPSANGHLLSPVRRWGNVRTQERACSSDSRFRRKLSGTSDIVFRERRGRRCCVWQHGSGSLYLQSVWISRRATLASHALCWLQGKRPALDWTPLCATCAAQLARNRLCWRQRRRALGLKVRIRP